MVADVSNAPVAATVSEPATAATSSVTVAPATMVTSSVAVGTTPPVQVVGLLQLPPVAVEAMAANMPRCATRGLVASGLAAAVAASTTGSWRVTAAAGRRLARCCPKAGASPNRPKVAANTGVSKVARPALLSTRLWRVSRVFFISKQEREK